MLRVVIESPFAGDALAIRSHTSYARLCLKDSLDRGEAPIASHLLYTQVLDDNRALERIRGMRAGFTWNQMAQKVAVYTDHGISTGMWDGLEYARKLNIPIEYRNILKKGK